MKFQDTFFLHTENPAIRLSKRTYYKSTVNLIISTTQRKKNMKTSLVTHSKMITARCSSTLVGSAVEALKRIDRQAALNDPYLLQNVTDCTLALEKVLVKADAIIAQGEAQFEARPKHIINATSLRYSEIPEKIEGILKASDRLIENHESKHEELRKQGFTNEQAQAIAAYPQTELDANTRAISDLHNERKVLHAFLSSAPVYDASSLNMENLAPFLQHYKAEKI